MFVTSWLVLQIVAAGVTGAVEYPSATDFFMNFDNLNKLYYTGNAKEHISNIILYRGQTEYPIYNSNVENVYISDTGSYVSYILLCNETFATNIVNVGSVTYASGTPAIQQDSYNRLTLSNLNDVTSSRITYSSNTFDCDISDTFYVTTPGTYEISAGNSNTYAIMKKIVASPINTQAVTYNRQILAFHHGEFQISDYSDSTVLAAAARGRIYSDTPLGKYFWGTLESVISDDNYTTYKWKPVHSMAARLLLVAGGGAGGYYNAGGGGGGEVLYFSAQPISLETHSIVVGNGGPRSGFNGRDSSFDNIIVKGGGAGGNTEGGAYRVGVDGGSGGGGSRDSGTNSAGLTYSYSGNGFVNRGGDSTANGWAGGGGGGGAGGAGIDGFGNGNQGSEQGGNGGVGKYYGSEFSTTYGESGYFAGGGGGANLGSTVSSYRGFGGTGGGGDGAQYQLNILATSGQRHTGGGGGANFSSTRIYGLGGSGIVLLSYVPNPLPTLSFDNTNKLVLSSGPSKSVINFKNTMYNIETAQNIIISETGNYEIGSRTGNVFALNNYNVTSISAPSSSITSGIVSFHHGNFDNKYGDGSVSAAATNGRVYANTSLNTDYNWGRITSVSTTGESTTYSWTPSTTLLADLLLVGGGGSGGYFMSGSFENGGGGGGGGVVYKQNEAVENSSQTIVVGAGGVAPYDSQDKGTNSTALNYTALGGGGGSTRDDQSKIDGGSGGGAVNWNPYTVNGQGLQPQSISGGYGNDGGVAGGTASGDGGSAGGGGAGAVGGNGSGTTGGNGGVGISFANVPSIYGESGYFGAGGGGGGGSPGVGGFGGGGDAHGGNGMAHTGGGGGGNNAANSGAGNGGSGICLLVYTPILDPAVVYDGVGEFIFNNIVVGSAFITIKNKTTDDVIACGYFGRYPVPGNGTYSFTCRTSTTFAFLNDITISNFVKLYKYPPTDGVTTSLTLSSQGNINSTWNIINSSYGSGQYQSQANISSVSGNESYYAFDSDKSTSFLNLNFFTGIITLQLPSAKTIRKYIVWPYLIDGKRPSSWSLQGSNDGFNWTTLHSVSSSPPSASGDVYTISSPGSYSRYRLNITGNTSGDGIQIEDLALWGDI